METTTETATAARTLTETQFNLVDKVHTAARQLAKETEWAARTVERITETLEAGDVPGMLTNSKDLVVLAENLRVLVDLARQMGAPDWAITTALKGDMHPIWNALRNQLRD